MLRRLTLACFNTKPDKKKQQDPLNPRVTAAANNSCNFIGLMLSEAVLYCILAANWKIWVKQKPNEDK